MGGRGGRRGGFNGNEGAFRDRNAGSANNRTKPTEDGRQDRPARAQGTYDGREAIANAEAKEALGGDAAPTDGAVAEADAEPEDNHKSYEEYLADLAEKKLALGAGVPEARKPNEGSKQDKKWANAKAIAKEEEEDFVAAAAGKAKRERERKQKQTIDIDQRFVEAPEQRGGGRGGGRGGRGRGDGPSRGGRGEGRGGRGEGRGGRGGPSRGGRGGNSGAPRGGSAPINTNDKSAFPSLGA